MKILITGASGFLGRTLLRRLLEQRFVEIRCFVRAGTNTDDIKSLARSYPDATVEIFTGSLASVESIVQALEDVTVILHLAAGLKGSAADLFTNSVVASKRLLDAVVATGRSIRIVHISSFGVYATAKMRRDEVLTEATPLEDEPVRRDLYSYSKLRQEQLFWEYSREYRIPLVVMRPGVIYGPGGSRLSVRVGLTLGPLFLFFGGRNLLPLTYVDNCADAIIRAMASDAAVGEVFNVLDDDLPTCAQYLRRYQREVRRLRVVRMPYWAARLLGRWVERYSVRSKGQLPAVLTPYKVAANWRGTRFANQKLKRLGWQPAVATDLGLSRAFESFRAQDEESRVADTAFVSTRAVRGSA